MSSPRSVRYKIDDDPPRWVVVPVAVVLGIAVAAILSPVLLVVGMIEAYEYIVRHMNRRRRRFEEPELVWTIRRMRSLAETPRIYGAPGWQLYKIASWVYSPRTFQEVFEPVLSDMLVRYYDALAKGQRGKAAWVRMVGYWDFMQHVAAQIPVSLSRMIWRLWVSGGS